MRFPVFQYVKHIFVCEGCKKEVTERTSIRHIKQKKYCRKCVKNKASEKKFKKRHPNYFRNLYEKYYKYVT